MITLKPVFKSADQYVTQDGYPLGTEAWFVTFELHDNIWRAWGASAGDAVSAARHAIAEIERSVSAHGALDSAEIARINYDFCRHREWGPFTRDTA